MLLNNQWIVEKIKEETPNTCRQWKWKHNDPKCLGCSKSSSKMEIYSDTSLPQETQKISNNLMLCLKELPKKKKKKPSKTKPQVRRRKEIIKIKAEIKRD